MKSPSLPLLPLLLAQTAPALRGLLDQEGIVHAPFVPGAAVGRFVVYDSRRPPLPRLLPGQQGIDLAAIEPRQPDDVWGVFDDSASQRAVWRVGGLEVTEVVARSDKRSVRQALLGALRKEVEQAGGVWLRTAAVPYPYRSAFCFRLDHDQYVPDDLDATLAAIAGHADSVSHFLCASAYEDHPEAAARLCGADVGSHGYFHHTYADTAANLQNIRRGIDVLVRLGLEPRGFVAPLGRYNPALEAALVELAIPYSSEFALAYDDWPSWRAEGRLLQIPVHPVSLGICLEAAQRAEPDNAALHRDMANAWLEYACRLIAARHQAGELTVLYCHPDGRLGRYPEVLRGVLQQAGSLAGIWRTTLGQLERWWRQRQTVQYRVYREVEQYRVVVDHAPPGWSFGIEYCRGGHVAAMPLAGPLVRFAPSALAYQNRKAAPASGPLRFDPPHGLRHRLRRWLDWERVTPVEQIDAGHLRGWIKRTLRRLRR